MNRSKQQRRIAVVEAVNIVNEKYDAKLTVEDADVIVTEYYNEVMNLMLDEDNPVDKIYVISLGSFHLNKSKLKLINSIKNSKRIDV